MSIQLRRDSRRRRTLGRRDFYVASPETVTPTYGEDLVVNGNMESGDPPSGWEGKNAGVLSSVADERTAGAGTQSLDLARNGSIQPRARQTFSNLAGLFVAFAGWNRNVDATRGEFLLFDESGVLGGTRRNATTTWALYESVLLVLSGDLKLDCMTTTDVDTQSARYDDVSLKSISSVSMLGDVCEAAREGHFVTAWPTAPTDGNVVGMSICLDDESNPQNYVSVWHDGTNVTLGKWVAGTYTEVQAATAAAWSNGAELEIKKFGTAFTVSYNGAAVGTVQTIADAGVIGNVRCAWFTTNGSLKPTYFKHYRR